MSFKALKKGGDPLESTLVIAMTEQVFAGHFDGLPG